MRSTWAYLGALAATISIATTAPIPTSVNMQDFAPVLNSRTVHDGERPKRQTTNTDFWHEESNWKREPLGLQNGYHAELDEK